MDGERLLFVPYTLRYDCAITGKSSKLLSDSGEVSACWTGPGRWVAAWEAPGCHSDAVFSFLNSPNLQPGDRVSEDAPALEGEGQSLSHACCAQGSFKPWAEALRESSGTA